MAQPATQRRRTALRWAWIAALVPPAATLATFVGRRWWVFDNLAAFRAHLLVLLVASAVVVGWLAVRTPDRAHVASAIATVAVLALDAAVVVPLWTGRPADPGEGPTLTIAHLNLQKNDGDVDVVGFLEREDVDVFVVLEARPAWFERLQDQDLSGYELIDGGGATDSYVLTRLPVRGVGRPDVRSIPLSTLELVVRTEAGPVNVLAIHTSRPRGSRAAHTRDAQLAAAGRWAREHRDPVIVAGDMNATPWTRSFEQLLDDGALDDSTHGFGYQASFPARLGPLGVPIDQSLYRGPLVPVRRELGPTFGSGHRSLVVEYRLDVG